MEVINIDSSDDDTPLRRPSAAASADSDDSSVSSLDSILDKPSIFKTKAAESTAKANRLATSAGSSAGIRRSNDGKADGKANGKAGKSKSTTNTKTKSNMTDAADGPEKKKPKKPRAAPKCQFYNRAFEESRMLSDALLPGDNRLYEYEAASNSSCDSYLGTWKCADYMFVARLISKADNETILDERVLDLIVERKDVNDLCSCLILPSKSHPPLQFFEAQMYKLQHCGLENKVFLLEGDEDNVGKFTRYTSSSNPHAKGGKNYGVASKDEQSKRLKRVKTLRMRIAAGEFKGVSIVNTLNRDESVKWLIHKMEGLRASFDPNNLPTRTKEAFDTYVKSRMKAPTFQEYLRLMSKDKIGDKKAMRIILDPALNWDKNFISPREAQSAKTTLSTLEDRATYWKESEAAATHRNLSNTKRRALYEGQKARGPVLGDDDCACGVCSRHIDVFSVDDDIIGCDRFKDCGRMFHKSCLLKGGYDINLSTGCVICKGKSKFLIKTVSKTASSKPGQKRPATSAVDRSEPPNMKAPPSSAASTKPAPVATKRKRADGVVNPPLQTGKPDGSKGPPKDGTKPAYKRRKEPDPDVYINKNAKTGLTARLLSSGIERNGASYNPLHDAGQSVAAALLLAEGAGGGGRKRPAQPSKKSRDKSRDSISSTGTARTEPE
ncbi:hypothetical protein THAOC_30748, partial [Thalassiosira oceanica]